MFSGVTCVRFNYIVLGVINKTKKLTVWKVPVQENTHMIQDSNTNKQIAKPKSIITSEYIMDWLPPHHSQQQKQSLFCLFVFSGSQIASSTGSGSGKASISGFSFP